MIWPVVTYAPTAATKPNIAAQPLKRSASGVMIIKLYLWTIVTAFMKLCKVIYVFILKKSINILRMNVKLAVLTHKCVIN